MMAVGFQTIAQVAAGRGLNTVVEGTALAAVSWGVLRLFAGRSSITRFAVWFSTLLLIAGLPLFSFGNAESLASLHMQVLRLSSEWAVAIFSAWVAISGVLLVRLALSFGHVYGLRRGCREIDVESNRGLLELVEQFPSTRRVRLLASDQIRVPAALGFIRPAVVLPMWALRELSPDALRGIVLHELAHLRRWDDWTNLAQQLVKALFFFHPAVWWIDGRLALEREMACDDFAVEGSASAKDYAASLVSVAEKMVAERMRMTRALALAQSALGRMKEVSLRVAQILEPKRRTGSRSWRSALAMIATMAAIVVAATPYAPEVISFQENSQPRVSTTASNSAPIAGMVVPVKLPGTAAMRNKDRYSRAGGGTRPYVGSARFSKPNASHELSASARVVPAKAALRKVRHNAKLVAAKAPANTVPAATWLVMRSTQVDSLGNAVWTLSVWRITSADGERLQETIVMKVL